MLHPRFQFIFAIIVWTLATFTSEVIKADPPNRVIRLSAIEGEASFLPKGEEEWVVATLNRPLITGDALWNDQKTQTILQLDNATLCLGEKTSITVLNLDDSTAQFQLNDGTINIRVSRLPLKHIYEIDTPNLAFSITQPGFYRITVDATNNSTTIDVREGKADVYGENNAYEIDAEKAYRFTGTDLQNYEELELASDDVLDAWCAKNISKPTQSQYVPSEMIGYEDLNKYGEWQRVEQYGYVWRPTEMDTDWAPYRTGQWSWIEPWGWTWIGEEPWGFAPYHYGRWAFVSGAWCWVPGPVTVYPVYAPALVAFIGGDGFELSVAIHGAEIAWFPLGPGDVFFPSYAYSESYFSAINLGAPLITPTLVAQSFKNKQIKVNYQNIKVANAITAVSKKAFVDAEKINKANVKVVNEKVLKAPITQNNSLKPVKESVLGTKQKAKSKPITEITSRPVVTKSTVNRQDKQGSAITTKATKPKPITGGKSEEAGKRPAKKDQTPLKPIDKSLDSTTDKRRKVSPDVETKDQNLQLDQSSQTQKQQIEQQKGQLEQSKALDKSEQQRQKIQEQRLQRQQQLQQQKQELQQNRKQQREQRQQQLQQQKQQMQELQQNRTQRNEQREQQLQQQKQELQQNQIQRNEQRQHQLQQQKQQMQELQQNQTQQRQQQLQQQKQQLQENMQNRTQQRQQNQEQRQQQIQQIKQQAAPTDEKNKKNQ
ncbi:MAG: hypothetical protein JSS07_02450 [Proteobacteria bacterium]|nr:hypothetical protein [Pseudomonadota bacterium]